MSFGSPYADIPIPEQPLTEFVLQRAVELADKQTVIEGLTNSIITYKQLADTIIPHVHNRFRIAIVS